MGARRQRQILVFSRRLPPGSRLWRWRLRASAKILRRRSHGLNFWPRESVGEDFFIDGLVAPPSPSVVLCSRASPLLICELQGLSSGWISEPQRGPTVAEFVTGSVQLKSKLMLGASVE